VPRRFPPLRVEIVFDAVVRDPAAGRPVTSLLENWGAQREDVADLAAQVQRKLVKAGIDSPALRQQLLYTGYLRLTDFHKNIWTAEDCKSAAEYAVHFDPERLDDIARARPELFNRPGES
jgi:hypothetical protein